MHVLLKCPLYESLGKQLTEEIRNLSVAFDEFCDTDKLSFILSNPLIAKASAKTCHLILKEDAQLYTVDIDLSLSNQFKLFSLLLHLYYRCK